MKKYVFLLGRERLLSLAELKSVFSGVESFENFACIETEDATLQKMVSGIGGTIKVGEILFEGIEKKDLLECVTEIVAPYAIEGKKLRLGMDVYIPSLEKFVFKVKDALKNLGKSIRVVQHDVGRVKTATTIHEGLIEKGLELMVFFGPQGLTVARTMWVQDIESYTDRDMNRERSMVVGMMPPKIAQIMINLATKGNRELQIWDPFCGLGTTLVEARHAGYTRLLGSDISSEMVAMTKKNIENQHGTSVQSEVFLLDATQIHTKKLLESTVVVTEGMLGMNFTPYTITPDKVLEERKKLTTLYQQFLQKSWENSLIQRMAFCLPFWNTGRETVYMPELSYYASSWKLDPLCQNGKRYLTHMRIGQSVGREILVVYR